MAATPADTDPFMLVAAAAEHVRQGVPEVELEWWADDADPVDGSGLERRLTITMRSAAGVAQRCAGLQLAARITDPPPAPAPEVPNDLSGLDE